MVQCAPQGGKRRTPGKKTSALARQAIAVLIDAGLRPTQLVELLSGLRAVKPRTLFNVRKGIRAQRARIRRAREQKERREREAKEREAAAKREEIRQEQEALARLARSFRNFWER